MKKYNIVIFNSVFEDLENIFIFCKNIFYSNKISKILESLLKESYSLDTFPLAYPIYYKTSQYMVRKKIVDKRYLIIFTIIQNSIFIYNIIDGRRNIRPNDLFK